MGYGAYMSLTNNLTVPVTIFVSDVVCMFDNGDEGSQLSSFNDVTVPPGGSLPAGGTTYIEAKGSGACSSKASTFTLSLEGIGTIAFTETLSKYIAKVDNTDVIHVDINNDSGNQATITITLYQGS